VKKLPKNKELTIKDFKENNKGVFKYKCGEYEIVFYEYEEVWTEIYIEVWHLVGSKRYRLEQETVDRRFTNNKISIKESNRKWWYLINRFYRRYCGDA